MPVTKSAQKQVRVSARRQVRNKSIKSQVKTRITKAEKLIASKELETAKQAVVSAVSSLDRAAGKGIIHENNAARHKSRLLKKLNQALASIPEQEQTKETTQP